MTILDTAFPIAVASVVLAAAVVDKQTPIAVSCQKEKAVCRLRSTGRSFAHFHQKNWGSMDTSKVEDIPQGWSQ